MSVKLFGIRVSVSYPLLCAAALCMIADVFHGFLFGAAAVAIHESGHLLAMRLLGEKPDSVKLSLFEIEITDRFRVQRSQKGNVFVIFSGPGANFICVLACFLLYLWGKASILPLITANASVGILNCMPVMSLDGGQLLYLLLSGRADGEKAGRAVDIMTVIIIIPLAVFGFLLLFRSKYNFSLLFVCAYLLLSLLLRDNRYY